MVQAADEFVRIIIRRPHAYTFIDDLFEAQGGISLSTPAGCTIGDGRTAPIPGIYFVDTEGEFIESVALTSTSAREDLAAALRRHTAR